MYEQVEKPKENKSRSVANSVAQKKSNGKQGFGLTDNRLQPFQSKNNDKNPFQLKNNAQTNNSSKYFPRQSHVENQSTSLLASSDSPANEKLVSQLMIVRARDWEEMLKTYATGKNGTIMSSSQDLKVRDELKKDIKWQDDIGITKATDDKSRQLDRDEPLIIVAHGSPPKKILGFLKDPTFAGKSPASLAVDIAKVLPDKYDGVIFLDGCYTGLRFEGNAGSSFIEKFSSAIVSEAEKKGKTVNCNVTGNIGAAITLDNGVEKIEINSTEAGIAKTAGIDVQEETENGKTEYYVEEVFGRAISNNGSYSALIK